MIRRLLSSVFTHTAYATDAMLCRNISKWWSRRSGWVVGSLIRDDLFNIRCMRALAVPTARDFNRFLTRRLNWRIMDLKGGWA